MAVFLIITSLRAKGKIEEMAKSDKGTSKSKLKTFVDISTVVLLLAGAAIGFFALKEYKASSKASTESFLMALDKQVYQKLHEKPYLQALFAHPPENIYPTIGCKQLLLLFLNEENDNKKKDLSFTWKDIPDLYSKLFQAEGFNNEDRIRLREGYFIAEDILYIMLNAYQFLESKMYSEDDYETWIAYIYDLGHNPLFWTAFYCGHKYGYVDQGFAANLVEHIKGLEPQNNILIMLKDLYPELFEDGWVGRLGERRATKYLLKQEDPASN